MILYALPAGAALSRDAEGEAVAPPLGAADEVRAKIARSLPETDWSDPSWGTLEADEYTIEFNLAVKEHVRGLTCYIHGGASVLEPIARLCRDHGWSAFDTTTGKLLDPDAPSSEGVEAFNDFRSSVTAELIRPPEAGQADEAELTAAESAKAQVLFDEMVRLADAQDERVADLYADDARIIEHVHGITRRVHVPHRRYTGAAYREALRKMMAAARRSGQKIFNSRLLNPRFSREGRFVRIRCLRVPPNDMPESPLSLLVGPIEDGDWLIHLEEYHQFW